MLILLKEACRAGLLIPPLVSPKPAAPAAVGLLWPLLLPPVGAPMLLLVLRRALPLVALAGLSAGLQPLERTRAMRTPPAAMALGTAISIVASSSSEASASA